jgi:hypothetical protein
MLLVPILWAGAGACGSTPQAPIPDPGGPFQTTVPASETISKLTASEAQQLCSDLTVAYQTFLGGAVDTEVTCRTSGVEAAAQSIRAGVYQEDAGADQKDAGSYQGTCQAAYDNCKQELSGTPGGYCPLAAIGCNATVELLSACLNEIAAGEPIQMCIGLPTCDMISEDQPVTQTPPPKMSDLPRLAACVRLSQQCPSMDFTYPCGTF